ncbi:hypothetical protein BDZ94DRAFT_1241233 [Collybia nuda]|uniref:Uncharacterized protein n=1 Tax=Collybia nuda TaxID=64659 RepID=A0A9P5XSD7_9AGAR|nr:hypothetical protein BDZ94DRAFT_1241233 [Collybia nuda]
MLAKISDQNMDYNGFPNYVHPFQASKDRNNIENIAHQLGLLRTKTINGFPTDPPPENAINWDPILCTYDEMDFKVTLDALANYFNEQNPSVFHPRVIWILSEIYPCLRITSNYSSGGEIPDDDYMSRLRDFFGLQGQPMWYLDENRFRWMRKKTGKQ